jgi:hypothetical protein
MELLERKMCHSGARFQTVGLPQLCKNLVYTFCFLLGFSRLTYLKLKKYCVPIMSIHYSKRLIVQYMHPTATGPSITKQSTYHSCDKIR